MWHLLTGSTTSTMRGSLGLRLSVWFLLMAALGGGNALGDATHDAVRGDQRSADYPNIVIILADDMGFGDVRAYNAASKIPTPNLDQLAKQGMRFVDAHSPSAVCTPSRYSLLTGRYAWRSRLKSEVLWGYSPLLIEEGRETLASLLKRNGYATAAIGKWHLGLGRDETDYFKVGGLQPGPNEVGFDYFFGIPASLDMKPYVYVENGRVHRPLTGRIVESSKPRRGGGGGFWRAGQIAEGFEHSQVLSELTEAALGVLDKHHADGADKPLFLYFSLTAPHTPWLPSAEFEGRSEAGPYGDFAVQVDDVVGQILARLDRLAMSRNTVVIFTSDNGAHWVENDKTKYGHRANADWRGQKADIFEGGHRVPFIVRWPDRIAAESVSEQLTTFTDLLATVAEIVGDELDSDAGEDGVSILPALLGDRPNQARPAVVHHSKDGMFAIRSGDWKLIEGLGSGGFTQPRRIEVSDGDAGIQLYNLGSDPGETTNLAAEDPDIAADLLRELSAIRESGRSR